ncbi:MAG TPA: serine/threonine-protein kinase, partial [Myxococcota bacterium]|nr:serine/threonine-protein kinase [Myxococcota bacterium]
MGGEADPSTWRTVASPSDGPPLVPPEGRWSRRYEPAQRLGVGAFGEVWLARDTSLGEDVAIKVLRLSSSSDLARLRRETSALRVAQVPGVVRIRDDFRVDDRAFIVMDLVNGRPFGDGGPHAWAAVEPQVHALLATLARLHFAGLVHRDLKPTNILVDGRGNPIVLDLGVAAGRGGVAPRSPGGFEGTRYYAAPEQLDGLTVTARADMYALGAMLFEVLIGRASRELSGRLLSGGPSVAAVQAEEGVAAVPPAVARLMLALLAPSPDDRPDAVEALRMLGGSPPVVPASRVATLPARAGVDELRGLFHGPDVYLRLQEDAAAVLVARTGGRSDRVVAELDAWVRAGLATWEGDAARLDRASIGRLQAGAIVRVCGAPEVVGPDLDVVRAIRLLGPEATTARVAATLGVTSSAVLATLERLASRDMAWPLGGDRWGAEPVVERAIPAQERMAQVTGALSCLPSASDVRVALLVEVDAPWREIVDAVGARAEALVAEGRFHDCLARVELAASIARERGIGELPRPLVVAGTSAACFLAEPRAIERMRLVL